MLLIVGFTYILMWGGLTLLRREGLSFRFAVDAIAVTLIFSALAAWTGFQPHPILFLLVLYLITMRSRLCVDIANALAQRGQFRRADVLYNLAGRMWPDQSVAILILLNQGVSYLSRGDIDQAIALLDSVMQKAGEGYLGIKNKAAAHYNLGVAYLGKNKNALAVIEFNAVLDTWPASEYARRAAAALEKHHHSAAEPIEEEK